MMEHQAPCSCLCWCCRQASVDIEVDLWRFELPAAAAAGGSEEDAEDEGTDDSGDDV
jgi:hypothetical protein